MKLKGRTIFPGLASGIALVTTRGISFYGGVDPESGRIVEKDHELFGQYITGKILVFPTGKGSTVGSYTLYQLKFLGKAPIAIVNSECETITAVGCIISEIPCMDMIDIKQIKTGDLIYINTDHNEIEVNPINDG